MLILGNAFDGAREFYNADWHLQSTARRARWLPQFTPVNYIALRFIYELLKHLFGVTYVVTWVAHSPLTLRVCRQGSTQ